MTATLHLTGTRADQPRSAPVISRPAFYNEPGLPCTTVDPDLFHSDLKGERDTAVKLCRRCPFQQECDAWATENGEKWGVWGGKVRHQPKGRRRDQDAALDGNGITFRRLTDEQKRTVVEKAIGRGMAWSMLAQTVKVTVVELMDLAPEAASALNRQVQDLYAGDHNDTDIADAVGLSRRTVKVIRERLGLQAKFSASGYRLPEPMTAAAQQAERDRLTAAIRRLYDQDLCDSEIAAVTGRSRPLIQHIRANKLGLPSKPGKPGRRPRKAVAA
jgi:hypothetical protein